MTTGETAQSILDNIAIALEARGYVGMANARDVGALLDRLEQFENTRPSSDVSEEAVARAIHAVDSWMRPYDDLKPEYQDMLKNKAKAVIALLKGEPSAT